MIVYVESNFVFELAFLQEQHRSCTAILDMAGREEISLVLPAFCVAEPYETLVRRAKERDELHSRLSTELNQLARSAAYEDAAKGSSEVIGLLMRSGEEEKRRLDDCLLRTLSVADVVPIDAEVFAHALELQAERSLGPQDAMVYASVLRHLSATDTEPKCFLNRNSKDFLTRDIQNDLSRHDCRLIPSFDDGRAYIERYAPA